MLSMMIAESFVNELFDLFDALTLDDLVGSDLFPSSNNAILRK